MFWLICHWLERESLVHLFDNVNLSSYPILKFEVMWALDHVDSPDGEVFLQGIVDFFPVSVKPRIRSDLDFLCLCPLWVNKLFQALCLN